MDEDEEEKKKREKRLMDMMMADLGSARREQLSTMDFDAPPPLGRGNPVSNLIAPRGGPRVDSRWFDIEADNDDPAAGRLDSLGGGGSHRLGQNYNPNTSLPRGRSLGRGARGSGSQRGSSSRGFPAGGRGGRGGSFGSTAGHSAAAGPSRPAFPGSLASAGSVGPSGPPRAPAGYFNKLSGPPPGQSRPTNRPTPVWLPRGALGVTGPSRAGFQPGPVRSPPVRSPGTAGPSRASRAPSPPRGAPSQPSPSKKKTPRRNRPRSPEPANEPATEPATSSPIIIFDRAPLSASLTPSSIANLPSGSRLSGLDGAAVGASAASLPEAFSSMAIVVITEQVGTTVDLPGVPVRGSPRGERRPPNILTEANAASVRAWMRDVGHEDVEEVLEDDDDDDDDDKNWEDEPDFDVSEGEGEGEEELEEGEIVEDVAESMEPMEYVDMLGDIQDEERQVAERHVLAVRAQQQMHATAVEDAAGAAGVAGAGGDGEEENDFLVEMEESGGEESGGVGGDDVLEFDVDMEEPVFDVEVEEPVVEEEEEMLSLSASK